MTYIVKEVLSLPIGGRAAIFFGSVLMIWLIFAKPLLKLLSIVPWIFKKMIWYLYMLLEIPVSISHRKFGGIFGAVDQGITIFFEKIHNFMEKLYQKIHNPNKLFRREIFIIYLILCAYLLIPVWANLTEEPFTFWQSTYEKNEMSIVQWMIEKGWIEL